MVAPARAASGAIAVDRERNPPIMLPDSHPKERKSRSRRLLFVADASVAAVTDLPPAVRVVIDSAAEVYVLTPTLPGRLAWLADDVDSFRHVADERLDTVLCHMHSIGANASGAALRGSVVTVIADAVAEFNPDHILLALRGSDHANWQERRLIEHIEERFQVPVTTYSVDAEGHTSSADGPVLLCYDESEDAKYAIEKAGTLLASRHALVVTVWQPLAGMGGIAWAEAPPSLVNFAELDRAAAEDGGRVASDGVRVAHEAGLEAEPLAVKNTGSVWKTILETAERHDAAVIVMGSRGLSGIRSMLLGSVSNAVVHHADRPTLVVHPPSDEAGSPHSVEDVSQAAPARHLR
jgi:nucleotide-binding universal stress UspA family protein